jgi:hypothetical protein
MLHFVEFPKQYKHIIIIINEHLNKAPVSARRRSWRFAETANANTFRNIYYSSSYPVHD